MNRVMGPVYKYGLFHTTYPISKAIYGWLITRLPAPGDDKKEVQRVFWEGTAGA